jgi:hypothetical protein
MVKGMMVAVLLVGPGVARGEPAQAAAPEQRSIGFGPEIGVIGIGGAIHAGGPAYGASLAASVMPVIIVQPSTIDLFATADVRADLYAYAAGSERGHFGPLAGASYNTLLGAGFNLGAGGTVRMGRKVELSLKWVFIIYPDANSRLLGHIEAAQGEPTRPWLQGGGSIGLLFYP